MYGIVDVEGRNGVESPVPKRCQPLRLADLRRVLYPINATLGGTPTTDKFPPRDYRDKGHNSDCY